MFIDWPTKHQLTKDNIAIIQVKKNLLYICYTTRSIACFLHLLIDSTAKMLSVSARAHRPLCIIGSSAVTCTVHLSSARASELSELKRRKQPTKMAASMQNVPRFTVMNDDDLEEFMECTDSKNTKNKLNTDSPSLRNTVNFVM